MRTDEITTWYIGKKIIMRVVRHWKRGPGKGIVSKLNWAKLWVRAANSDWTCFEQEVRAGTSGSPFHLPRTLGLAPSFSQRERWGGPVLSRRHGGGREAWVRRPAGGNPMHNARKICSLRTDVGISAPSAWVIATRLYPTFTSVIPPLIHEVCAYQEALIRNWVTWFFGEKNSLMKLNIPVKNG